MQKTAVDKIYAAPDHSGKPLADAKEGKLSGNAKKPGKSIKEKRAEKRAKSAGAEPAPRKRKGQ